VLKSKNNNFRQCATYANIQATAGGESQGAQEAQVTEETEEADVAEVATMAHFNFVDKISFNLRTQMRVIFLPVHFPTNSHTSTYNHNKR